jgi:hypothetical protein
MSSGKTLEEAATLNLPQPTRCCREPSGSSSVRLTRQMSRAPRPHDRTDRLARRLHLVVIRPRERALAKVKRARWHRRFEQPLKRRHIDETGRTPER